MASRRTPRAAPRSADYDLLLGDEGAPADAAGPLDGLSPKQQEEVTARYKQLRRRFRKLLDCGAGSLEEAADVLAQERADERKGDAASSSDSDGSSSSSSSSSSTASKQRAKRRRVK